MKAVILAGGKGTRLKPYTTILPKPLMPIGDMPILEILLRQMKRAGVDEAVLTVGHLAEMLRLFFQDGEKLGLTITYSYEDAPLGTAARAKVPSSSSTSTSTVGLPRESRISRAPMASMLAMKSLLFEGGRIGRREHDHAPTSRGRA